MIKISQNTYAIVEKVLYNGDAKSRIFPVQFSVSKKTWYIFCRDSNSASFDANVIYINKTEGGKLFRNCKN